MGRLTKDDLVGIFPALPTPLDDEGKVDAGAVRRLVEFLLGAGVDGLVPVGGTGEYAALSPADRRRMVEATVAAAAGRVPVIAGILSPGFKEALAAARDAEAAGADALMLVTPYYVHASGQGIRDYFAAFAAAVDCPVLLYEIPARTGVALTAETVAGMVEDGSIIGMKACNGDFAQFTRLIDAVGERIGVLGGEEPYFPTHVAMGASGGILATANLVPAPWLEIFRLARDGDLPAALKRHAELYPLLDAIFAEVNPGPLKAALALAGLPVGQVLLPLRPPGPEAMARLEAALSAWQSRAAA
jgi:4-hydroxy-tetrahydrodipicolinate synthase